MPSSDLDKLDAIGAYLERFPEQWEPENPQFPFVPTHPMTRVLKYIHMHGTLDALSAAASEALRSGTPITDWSPFVRWSRAIPTPSE